METKAKAKIGGAPDGVKGHAIFFGVLEQLSFVVAHLHTPDGLTSCSTTFRAFGTPLRAATAAQQLPVS